MSASHSNTEWRPGGKEAEERDAYRHNMANAPAARSSGEAEPPQDALAYVRMVKSRFQTTRPQVYEQFLEVMRDFKNERYAGMGAAVPPGPLGSL